MSSLSGNSGYVGPTGSSKNQIPSGYKAGQIRQFDPQQMQLFQQLFSNVSPDSYTSRLAHGDESLFGEMEEPALRQFAGLQGNIASRFSGMGIGGRRSSGFQNTMNQASSDFATGLKSQRQSLQRQAIQDLMGMSNDLLGKRPYEQFLVKKQKPWWQDLLGQVSPVGGDIAEGDTKNTQNFLQAIMKMA